MAKKKKPVKRFTLRRITRMLALFCIPLCIVYYLLPWSVREPVYRSAKPIDQALMKSGHKLVQAWDELGLFGKDCTVPADSNWAGEHALGGLPSDGFKLRDRSLLLHNTGYTVGYSERLKDPLWSAYRVFNVNELNSPKRPGFKRDRRSTAGVAPDHYTGSGFDRGHLAPNFAIATRYGAAAQHETFLMTNIMPQNPIVNRYLWKDLEHRVAEQYGRCFSDVWVITGPVFTPPLRHLQSGVTIPTAYYKIIADLDRGNLRVMAFLVDEKIAPYTRVRSCLVSVDQLEELTGLNFFPDLPNRVQDELEKEPAGRLWPWIVPALRYHLTGKTR